MIYLPYGTPPSLTLKIYQFRQQVLFHLTFVINFLDNIKFAYYFVSLLDYVFAGKTIVINYLSK